MSSIAYLSLGSNIGDRQTHLLEAIGRLKDLGMVRAISSFYETEPVEFTDQDWFLNCAVTLETDKSPAQLIAALFQIEEQMGRLRIQKKGPRIIDIDILLFGDAVIRTKELTIPHPAMTTRRFVLEPLAEIAPNAIHPALNKTVQNLLEELSPGQEVRRVSDGRRPTNEV